VRGQSQASVSVVQEAYPRCGPMTLARDPEDFGERMRPEMRRGDASAGVRLTPCVDCLRAASDATPCFGLTGATEGNG